jgi:hypothetical protein
LASLSSHHAGKPFRPAAGGIAPMRNQTQGVLAMPLPPSPAQPAIAFGSGNTLPILVMSTLRRSVTPMTNAIGAMHIGLSIASTLTALYLTRYRG